jgi:SOS-response transcriptional repressor LexA
MPSQVNISRAGIGSQANSSPLEGSGEPGSVVSMTLRERLMGAIKSRGMTQKEVALRAGLEESTVSNIVNGKVGSPSFDTVARMVEAIGISWAEFFDEPRLGLTDTDVQLAEDARELLGRLIAADRALKEQRGARIRPVLRKRRRNGRVVTRGDVAAGPRETYPDVYNLPTQVIPQEYYRAGATRAYRVEGDSMIGAGIFDGSVIYVRPTQDKASIDGKIAVVRLNGSEYVKRLDLRGGGVELLSENPRIAPMIVEEGDEFVLIGEVIV